MKATAGELMDTQYDTLKPDLPLSEAVRAFRRASTKGRKIFGMMVTDDTGQLIGMLSMYDILLYMRPKHIHIWGDMDDIDVKGIMDMACEKAKSVRVGDIMTTEVVTTTPSSHILRVMDLMIKKHIRRLPVLENGQIRGIIYISDLFYDLLERLSYEGTTQ
ncbi:MAG: CBS domain-containing protein [Desulfosoma sp.]|uniref:CBS domain-containing protein n=1 Tax=Desulfosoma sp. TaxID=2603217 RepID=UPI00404A797E